MTAKEPTRISLYREQEQTGLSLDSVFRFHCQPGLPCFNHCCHTPAVLLSPYDLLRLRQALGLPSGEILSRYTLRGVEEASNLPLVFLDAHSHGACPFLEPAGCGVYPHRPAACRLFPLTMGSQLSEAGVVDHYFCRRLDYCRGFDTEVQWTVASWLADQGFAEYDQGRREWLEILLRTGLGGRVEAKLQEQVYLIAYDLDEFRRLISAPWFPGARALDDATREALQRDDPALLQFGYRYLQSILLRHLPHFPENI